MASVAKLRSAVLVGSEQSQRESAAEGSAMTIGHTIVESPVGPLLLTQRAGALTGLWYGDHARGPSASLGRPEPAAFKDVVQQLDEYFAGERREFDVELAPAGTPFQLEVWNALRNIPYGATASYADIAAQVGRPTASRAVGAANGA